MNKNTTKAAPAVAPANTKADGVDPAPSAPTVKNPGVSKWLSVNMNGEASLLELAKLRVTHYLGVQLRDLRYAFIHATQKITHAPLPLEITY